MKAKGNQIRRYLQYLTQMQGIPLAEFKADFYRHGAAERYLHLCLEGLIDIGSHLISALSLPPPSFYREIAQILHENQILPLELKETFENMVGFRNVLVHSYASLDLDRIYEILVDSLSDIWAILLAFEEYQGKLMDDNVAP